MSVLCSICNINEEFKDLPCKKFLTLIHNVQYDGLYLKRCNLFKLTMYYKGNKVDAHLYCMFFSVI